MLTDKQKIAFFLLCNGEKVKTVAFACAVHRCTIWRWMKKKYIKQRFRIYCNLEKKRRYRSVDNIGLIMKYKADRDALLTARNADDRASIDSICSAIINEYYKPFEGKIDQIVRQRAMRKHT